MVNSSSLDGFKSRLAPFLKDALAKYTLLGSIQMQLGGIQGPVLYRSDYML